MNNPTYLLALLEQASRPRGDNSAAARAQTAKVLRATARMGRKVAADLKRAGIVLR